MTKDLPSIDELRKLLAYDPDTGDLKWLTRRDVKASWNTRYAGHPALACVHEDGYRKGRIHRKLFRAHRVAWALHHGRWPELDLDHINGNRSDNRIANLREVTRVENQRNMRLPSDNKSGVIGVYWNTARRKWVAEIRDAGGKKRHLGVFEDIEAAAAARRAAEQAAGYHENHGK
jgi:hypothetical protein